MEKAGYTRVGLFFVQKSSQGPNYVPVSNPRQNKLKIGKKTVWNGWKCVFSQALRLGIILTRIENMTDTSQWALCQEIFHTHDDAEVGHVLLVGFDERRDLVILLERYSQETTKERVLRKVAVRKEDAFRMARCLQLSMTALPGHLADRFSELDSFGGLAQAESILSDMLDYLLSIGVSYHQS